MSELQLDKTWPNPPPSRDDIEQVFLDNLGGSIGWNKDEHLERVRALVFSKDTYIPLTRQLHRTLSKYTANNDARLSARQVICGSKETWPLIKYTGIDQYADLFTEVLPVIRRSLKDVLESDTTTQEKLDITALTMGMIIAESQSFSDANTRVARAVHDYIKDGGESVSLERVSSSKRNFIPPNDIESIIMMQNLTQLIEHPEEKVLSDQGVMAVSQRAEELYTQANTFIHAIWQLDGINWSEYDTMTKGKELLALKQRIDTLLTTDDLGDTLRTRSVLMQKHYAAAAIAATFSDEMPSFPFTQEQTTKLMETNINLMKMRVRSLGVGMARRGIFMTVEKNEISHLAERHWLPNLDADM